MKNVPVALRHQELLFAQPFRLTLSSISERLPSLGLAKTIPNPSENSLTSQSSESDEADRSASHLLEAMPYLDRDQSAVTIFRLGMTDAEI
jgi:hypothetical protein